MKHALFYEVEEMIPIYQAVLRIYNAIGDDAFYLTTNDEFRTLLYRELQGKAHPQTIDTLIDKHQRKDGP